MKCLPTYLNRTNPGTRETQIIKDFWLRQLLYPGYTFSISTSLLAPFFESKHFKLVFFFSPWNDFNGSCLD